MNKPTILITGGSGFIGRNLINVLDQGRYQLKVLDIIKPKWLSKKVQFIEGSFTSEQILRKATLNCDIVIHLASTTLPASSNDDPLYDVQSNLIGTIKLLDLSVENGVRKFIFASSGGTVYGIKNKFPITEDSPLIPTCSYGIVKLTIEKYLRLYNSLHNIETCSLRFANPFGEYQRTDRSHGAIGVFCEKAIKNEEIHIWGDGSISRDFIYIKDVVSAIQHAIEKKTISTEINIGSGTATSLNDLISIIERNLKIKLKVNYLSSRSFDVPKSYLCINRANELLNWMPETTIENGILKTISWLKKDENGE